MWLSETWEKQDKNLNTPLFTISVKSFWSTLLKSYKWLEVIFINQIVLIWKFKMCMKTVGLTPCCFHCLANVNIKWEIKRKQRQGDPIRTFASYSISAYTIAVITKWTSWHGVPENIMQIYQNVHLHIHEYGKGNEFTVSKIHWLHGGKKANMFALFSVH